ncbi:MAG: hypothetical protein EOL88_13425 [Bacteroidia bacterium]|nr:hypothetical protein [Bacteroidales bacterium]MDD2324328.1 hypothetical protein [Bacteroidales bacterium]MDD3961019.1 hypothetical protein [Bacteroidales bacterium]MDY0286651.1 hypothetical protein [Bacteroidales bacterium]NCD43071.1 hypothetical protein [Bacteroidia bacterium]
MKSLRLFLVTGLLAFACCRPVLIDTYLLTEQQKSLIPYVPDTQVTFSFNGEKSFPIIITEVSKGMQQEYRGEESCQYYEYERKTAILRSVYPEINIEATVCAQNNESFKRYDTLNFSVRLGYKQFALNCQWDPTGISFCDTVLAGFHYHKVLVFNNCTDASHLSDTSLLYYQHIVWSQENGLELITFNNGDYYVLENQNNY